MAKLKAVHYINQFYGGVGGEEMAHVPPEKRPGPVGPGLAFAAAFGGRAEIAATIICGDSYFNENIEKAKDEIKALIEAEAPDLLIAGPAFNAGRYGLACAAVTAMAADCLGLPAVTGMYVENPGADMYKSQVYIVSTSDSAAGMRRAVPAMAALVLKLANGERIGASAEEGYIPRGTRVNFFEKKRGSARAVEMLAKKLAGKAFETEYPMPNFDRVPPNPAVKDIAGAKIALVTSGGIVPRGNPDHIESSSASHYGKYDLEGVSNLDSAAYETAHGGYDPVYANADADRVLPVDVMRELEREGLIGSLSRYYYSTVGNGTSVANAVKFSSEFAQELLKDQVQAVILTST